jgi:hypothetical protein
MLYFPKGRQFVGSELPIATGSVITAEGQALVGSGVAGAWGVKPSTGISGEKFIGVAVSQQLSLMYQTRVEDIIQPSTSIVSLGRIPVAGTLGVWDATASAFIATGGGGWTLSTQTLTLQPGTNGHELFITYRFVPTTLEARSIQGDIVPGGAAGNLVGQVGVIRNGIIYTTEFDPVVNWYAANPVVTTGKADTDAGRGLFTIGGNGDAVNCTVIATPSMLYPYLGLLLNY